MSKLDHVNYDVLDNAKNAFIAAGKKTLKFAEKYGFIPDEKFGASANVFALDLKPFIKSGKDQLYVTLVPEGLGTADDARPEDLTSAEKIEFWHNIGIKTVATMTNDCASAGMQPILISLYLPSSTPETVFSAEFMQGFLDGFVSACKTVGCVYFSGETPQLKTKIYEDRLDIAGAVFGVVPHLNQPINASELSAGDTIVFIQSSGPHENGFTSLRKIADKLPQGYRTKLPSGKEYWQALNAPSVLYSPLIQDALAQGIIPTSIEPITGHGWQKLMRSKKILSYQIENVLPVPEIFQFVQKQTNTSQEDMLKIFNYGVGLAVFLRSESQARTLVEIAAKRGLNAIVAGKVQESKQREVVVKPYGITIKGDGFTLGK